jgi:lysophospholipase L1-like esterase
MKIYFFLLVLGIVLCQNLTNNSQHSKKLYLSDEVSIKLESKKIWRAEYTTPLLFEEDNARKLLITEGTSTTAGYGVSDEYPRQLALLFGGNYYKQTVSIILDSNNLWAVRNVGNNGDTMTQITDQYASQVLPFYNQSRNINYLTLQGGSNDIAFGRTVADLKMDVAAYVAKAKADGFVVGVCTIFHRVGNDVGKVSDYNTWLRAGNSSADFIIDLAAHPFLSDATNTTYFQGDGIHTNSAGQSVITNIFADAIPAVGVTSAMMVTVGGVVSMANGKGIPNVTLTLTDENGNQRTTRSDFLGAYNFADVLTGQTYTITARIKRCSFIQSSQVININKETNDINFIGYSQRISL